MRRLKSCFLGALLVSVCVGPQMEAQEQSDSSSPSRTARPVIRGTQYAVSSMKLEATEAAVRILEAGGDVHRLEDLDAVIRVLFVAVLHDTAQTGARA